MADLPSVSFDPVNDIETAQGAPVSEALAQKYGSNDNNLDGRSTSNDSDIATNAADILTNAGNISSNDTDIATNAGNISTNTGNIATNVTNIGTNTTNIATNTADIAAIEQPEEDDPTLNPTGSFQSLFTFAASPTIVFVTVSNTSGNTFPVCMLTQNTALASVADNSANVLQYRLTGTLLEVREQSGTVPNTKFILVGWN